MAVVYSYIFLTVLIVHIIAVRGDNDQELRDYFLALLSIIERTERYLSISSNDLLEFCQRHLEGHLGILVAFIEVLDQTESHADVILLHGLQQLVDLVSRQLRRIDELSSHEESNINLNRTSVPPAVLTTGGGRPKYVIPKEQIERLYSYGMTWTDIAKIFHISQRTL